MDDNVPIHIVWPVEIVREDVLGHEGPRFVAVDLAVEELAAKLHGALSEDDRFGEAPATIRDDYDVGDGIRTLVVRGTVPPGVGYTDILAIGARILSGEI